jgi:glycosyltransferase involved in cell wall biosynthesis
MDDVKKTEASWERKVNKLHVCVVTETYPPEINGVARSLQRAVMHLVQQGYRVSLVRPRQAGDRMSRQHMSCDTGLAAELLTAGMPLPMYPDLRIGFASSRRLRAWLREGRPDVVHIATEGPLGLAALRAALRLDIPCTTDFRTNFHLYSRHYHFGRILPFVLGYLRWFHNRAAVTLVPTEAMRQMLAGEGFRNLAVVGRGVDTDLFSPAHRDGGLREAWGARETDMVVLHVGRLAAEKNIEMALRAFDFIRARNRDSRLVLVGDGPLHDTLRHAAPHALFTGWQRGAALASAYASADLFLFPSMTETFGNVLLEALASGLPCVAFRHGAAEAHLIDGQNGLCVPFGDERAFVDAAGRLAAEAGLRAGMARSARLTAQALAWHRILEGFESVLLAAADRSMSRHAQNLARAA